MWKSIKKFFKWIADCTGISWIARKISSGWKWLFGGKANSTQKNTSQKKQSSGNERQEDTQAKTLDQSKKLPENFPTPDPKNVDSDVPKEASNENYLKVSGKGLLLVLTSEQFAKCKDYKDSQSTSPGRLLMYIKCGENEYRIAGTNNDNLPNTICIESILKKSKDGKYVNGNIVRVEEEIKRVKKMLELDNDRVVKVDSISDKSFTDMVVKQADTPNQLIPSAVPNKSQGNGIVISKGAKLTFSPELEDLLRTKSLVREMLFYKVVPNSLLVQTREEQAAGSCQSVNS